MSESRNTKDRGSKGAGQEDKPQAARAKPRATVAFGEPRTETLIANPPPSDDAKRVERSETQSFNAVYLPPVEKHQAHAPPAPPTQRTHQRPARHTELGLPRVLLGPQAGPGEAAGANQTPGEREAESAQSTPPGRTSAHSADDIDRLLSELSSRGPSSPGKKNVPLDAKLPNPQGPPSEAIRSVQAAMVELPPDAIEHADNTVGGGVAAANRKAVGSPQIPPSLPPPLPPEARPERQQHELVPGPGVPPQPAGESARLNQTGQGHPVPRPRSITARPGQSLQPPPLDAAEKAASTPAESASVRAIREDATMLIANCEKILNGSPPPDARRVAQLHYEIARLFEYHLGAVDKAAHHYVEGLRHAPEFLPLLRGARRSLLRRGDYVEVLPLVDSEARITPETKRKATLHFGKGRILEDRLKRVRDAQASYATAFDLDRSDTSILKSLEQWAQEQERWQDLAVALGREANAVAADPKHRSALTVRKAKLLESKLGDIDGAIELYEVATRLNPHEHSALEALKRLHHAQRRWRDLIRVLEAESRDADDHSVRVMAYYRIGRIYAERLGSQQEAMRALEKALEYAPTDPLVLEELARLYESGERFDALVGVLESLAQTVGSAEQRLALFHRIGQLLEEKLDRPDDAITWFEKALELKPTYTPALQAAGKLYTERGNWLALARMHRLDAEHADEASRRAAAHARVAEILETRLGQVEEATEHHSRALSVYPGYPPSFKALARIYTELKKWRELVELYEREVDLALAESQVSERAITYLMKAGAVYEDDLADFSRAAYAYRRVLELVSDHMGAIHALQRATERGGRYEELVQAIELEAEKTRDPKRTVALLQRAGEVVDDKLNDRDRAMKHFRRVLKIDPKYVPALTHLGRIYYRAGRWEDLLEMYRRELELTRSDSVAIALLEKMADICLSRIGREEEAMDYYRRALRIDPSYQPAVQPLSRYLRERREWPELAQILEQEMLSVSEAADKVRAAYRIGEVYEEHLNQSKNALEAYLYALEALPAYRPARDARNRLLAETQQWSDLATDLEREVEATPDSSLRIRSLLRQGEIWAERLANPEKAIACLQECLAIQADHTETLITLEGIYRRVGLFRELANVVRQQAEVFVDSGAKIAALRELARLLETHRVGEEGELKATLLRVLDIQPHDVYALETLETLALRENDRPLLIRVDRSLAKMASEPLERAEYELRIAENLEALDDLSALDAYRTALEDNPESLAATRGFSRMAERTDDPNALAEAARREASIAGNSEAAARLLVRSATVRIDRLGDRLGARADLERALDLCPDHSGAAKHLASMLRAEGQEQRLADLLSRAAGLAKKQRRRVALWLEAADLHAGPLNNIPTALSALQRVLREDEHNAEALTRSAKLYERNHQWSEAVQFHRHVSAHTEDKTIVLEANFRLAVILDERFGETEQAFSHLRAALEVDPKSSGALERLSDLQEREGNLKEAAATAEKLIHAAPNDGVRSDALVRLARVKRRLGADEVAAQALWRAVALQGPSGSATVECKNFFSTALHWENYSKALDEYLRERAQSSEEQRAALLEVAETRYTRLRDAKGAVAVLENGLELVDNDAEIRRELALRLRMAGRHSRSVMYLQSILLEEPTRSDAWRDLAQTFKEMGYQEELRLAIEPVEVLRTATSNEAAFLREAKRQPGALAPGSLPAALLAQLGTFTPSEMAAIELLAILQPCLEKLYPPDLDAYGVSSRDRLGPKIVHPLRQYADQVAGIFGIDALDLFVHRSRQRGVAVEFTDPPSLLLPASLVEVRESHLIFALSRAMTNLAQGLYAFDKLMPRELEILLASAVRHAQPQFGTGLTNEEILDDLSRRTFKALPRRLRKSFDSAAEKYVGLPKVNFANLAKSVALLAAQVAAVVCDDLPTAAEVVQGARDRPSRHEGGGEGVSVSETVRGLLAFWASPHALQLREITGLLPRRSNNGTSDHS